MPSKRLTDRLRSVLEGAGPILRTRTFWTGLGAILAFWAVVYFVMDNWAMPAYTRHGVQISVPDVRQMPFEEAERMLAENGFSMGQLTKRFDPALPRDLVLHQEPPPYAQVKPGRRIYLTVNSGDAPRVAVPDLQFVSMREAKSRLATHRLLLGEVREDTLPAPFKNTVVRQLPAAGDSVLPGTIVSIWISSGLGDSYVPVPDVVGLSVPEAERLLAATRLRLVVLEDPSIPESRMDTVVRQLPLPETEVRTGSEIRGFARMSEAPMELISVDTLATEAG